LRQEEKVRQVKQTYLAIPVLGHRHGVIEPVTTVSAETPSARYLKICWRLNQQKVESEHDRLNDGCLWLV